MYLNVLDFILNVNIVLGTSEFSDNPDINQDGLINVLDIVLMVELILDIYSENYFATNIEVGISDTSPEKVLFSPMNSATKELTGFS